MSASDQPGRRLIESLGRPFPAEELFDVVPDIVFFVKDHDGRYVSVNRTLADRCGLDERSQAIGHTALELFPPPLGEAYARQDREIIRTGRGIRDRLELHLYPYGRRGWCLTYKEPLADRSGRIIGLCGISRDLRSPFEGRGDLDRLSTVLDHIHQNIDQPLRLGQLAEMARLSPYQLDQRIRSLFQLSVRQFLIKVRIDSACEQLNRSDQPIANIALDCGYSDQSAFSRQFRQVVGISPLAYRKRSRSK